MSHSRWICRTLVSWAICYCSNRQQVFLTQSWSRTCNVCWCADAAYGDFHASSACHIHICESMKIISEEKVGWRWWHVNTLTVLNTNMLIHSCMLLNTHTHTHLTAHVHRCMHTHYLPRAAERRQSGSSLSLSPASPLYPKSSTILLCVDRNAAKSLSTLQHQGPWNKK